ILHSPSFPTRRSSDLGFPSFLRASSALEPMRTPLKSLNVGSASPRCARACAGALTTSAIAATKKASLLSRLEKNVKEKQNIWNRSEEHTSELQSLAYL